MGSSNLEASTNAYTLVSLKVVRIALFKKNYWCIYPLTTLTQKIVKYSNNARYYKNIEPMC